MERNQSAERIARSVTEEHRYQSYIARGGPIWLKNLLTSEEVGVSSIPGNSINGRDDMN